MLIHCQSLCTAPDLHDILSAQQMNPMGFLLRNANTSMQVGFSCKLPPIALEPLIVVHWYRHCLIICSQPLPIYWPCFPAIGLCLRSAWILLCFCSHSSSTVVATLDPTSHSPISSRLCLVAVGSWFVIRYKLTFKEKKSHQSNCCSAIDLLGMEPGRCLTFALLSMGEEGAGLFFPTRNVSIFECKVLSLPWDPKQFLFTDSGSLEAYSLSWGDKCFSWFAAGKVTAQLAKTVNLKVEMFVTCLQISWLWRSKQFPPTLFLCVYIQSSCRFDHKSYWVRIQKQSLVICN